MRIIVVVGTGSGCGKTTAACRILAALPGLGAVKISPRAGPGQVEWGAGAPGKDTDLFARSGADPVARIVGPRELTVAAWQGIRERFAGCRGVVIEGAGALDFAGERYVVFVAGETREAGRRERDQAIAALADLQLSRASPEAQTALVAGVRAFLARPSGAPPGPLTARDCV
jgi:hypothetical protein